MPHWTRWPRLKRRQAAHSRRPSLRKLLATGVRNLVAARPGATSASLTVEALTKARDLASRIGDESNLTLDPDLDSYYVQNIAVKRVPALLSQMGRSAVAPGRCAIG